MLEPADTRADINRPSGRFGFASVSAFSVSNRRGDRPHSHSFQFSTLKAPKRLRARNRASGAIDGGAPTPDCKPSGLNRRRLATVTLPPPPRLRRTSRVFRSRRRHGNSPFGRKTRSGTRFNPSVFFARRANFSVAGEAENRRLMSVRVTAAELARAR